MIPDLEKASESYAETDIRKYRVTFSKTGQASYLSHLELARLFMRAARRAGLHMVFSKGFHPMPRISFSAALPVGTGSIHETVNLDLYGIIPPMKLKGELNLQLPEDIRITLVEDISNLKKEALIESHYRITLEGIEADRACLESFINSHSFPIIKTTKGVEREVDARCLVKSIGFAGPDTLHLVITHVNGPEIKPAYIIKEIFGLRDDQIPFIKILKTKQILG